MQKLHKNCANHTDVSYYVTCFYWYFNADQLEKTEDVYCEMEI